MTRSRMWFVAASRALSGACAGGAVMWGLVLDLDGVLMARVALLQDDRGRARLPFGPVSRSAGRGHERSSLMYLAAPRDGTSLISPFTMLSTTGSRVSGTPCSVIKVL